MLTPVLDTKPKTDWIALAEEVLAGKELTKEEALGILHAPDTEVLSLLQGAYRIRSHYYGNKVKLNMIINAKSGLCPEDCGYCSQSIVSNAPIEKYPQLSKDVLVDGARKAKEAKAGTYCIVMSGRRPTDKEVDNVIQAVREIKEQHNMKICACLGLITPEQARRLKEAGVDRFNHNINTAASHHANITSTHTYDDRINTINAVKEAGMSPCSGVIIGMGETDEEIVDMANALRELNADSIPVNFLNAIPGTPLGNMPKIGALKCLKVLALFRYINPTKEIRISGGREVNLRHLQPMGLYAANSIFVGDYLTTDGQKTQLDHEMIEDLGFEIEECAFDSEPPVLTK
ncbi:biotin synthase BioB [Aneurinibacillus thermoaerophilus]|jgi:biotin synthase|uniref:biotin synthase BioB n=1 Tax=Aneurinibacillus TaxID=55079 RepID=UPI00070AE237|nr:MULTISPECIES: biotin synthase BioB [Aneurinibacillus]AMA72058.1 biotin synthase [Aneurinibacillus sp. XH2]MED0677451.1 biotin synthase BioB [Aneurinibacillus thermoaerophilus]MED0678861.1 biotin synthase BioB [Aneurinibacillus thermoaerophilus]MED0763061.1 biotin synthase BioB [Aneurinibacillus thermoaerophilus]